MDLIPTNGQKEQFWHLETLTPAPSEEWDRLRDFLNITRADIQAMVATVEPLFRLSLIHISEPTRPY